MMCKKFIIVLALSLLLISSAGAGTVTWDFENGNNHGFNLQSTYSAAAAIDDPNIAGDESITGAGGFSGLPDVGVAWTVGPPNQFDGQAPVVEEGCHIVDGVLEYGPCNDPFGDRVGNGFLNTYNLSQWGDNLHIADNDQIASSPVVILDANSVLTVWSLGGGSGTHAPEYDPDPSLWYTDGSSGIAVISAEGDDQYALLATLHLNGKGTLTEDTLDLSAFAGRKVFIDVVDAFEGGWGWLAVDEIQITNAVSKNAMFVVGIANLSLGFDQAEHDRLEYLGYAVSVVESSEVSGGSVTIDYCNGFNLLIISESIMSYDADNLIGTTTPIMHNESHGWDNWFFQGAPVLQGWQTGSEVDIVNDTHPIVVNANVSMGTMQFFDPENEWTTEVVRAIAPGAEIIASAPINGEDYAIIFAIEEGAELANGTPATARTVGFSLPGQAYVAPEVMTDEAWALWDASIAWLDPPATEMVEPIADYSFDVDASDATGNYDGTLEGDAAIVDDAERGAVLGLTADGYVSIPTSITAEMDDFSFSAWVNFAGTVSWAGLLGMGSAAGHTTPYWDFHIQGSGTLSFYASLVDVWPGDGTAQTVTGYTLPAEWTHIAFTFTLGSVPLVYVNGEVQTTTDWNSSNDHDVSPSMIAAEMVNIGRDCFNQGTLTNTLIDDFKFYNVALSADDVAAIYDAEK